MAILTELQEQETSVAYDVFMSFRGKDTRLGFVDHLYQALINENICTFLDEEDVETGEELKPELERAIKGSRASIIVLSENYASSTWCLDELVMILEQKRCSNSKHFVLPIFYHVEPSHVRKQESSFGEALTIHKQRIEAEKDQEKSSQRDRKLDLWKKALTEVADLKGKDANGCRETMFIEEIVKEINGRLGLSLHSTIPQLIGMDSSIHTISSWVREKSSKTASILTIWGMAGIGKTTLAEHIYMSSYLEFERTCFLQGIERKCAQQSGALLDLQKQILRDLLKRSTIEVKDVNVGTAMLEKVLLEKQTLLVLDGIDKFEQLNVLIGTRGLHSGTKVIVTTKDGSLTEKGAIFRTNFHPRHKKHKLSGLNFTESLRILCWHAFGVDGPKEGYEEEAEIVAKYCEGHPLALKILASALINKDIDTWCDVKNMLEVNDYYTDVEKVLRISFDSLPSDNCKELFKHIACFFVGEDKEVTEATLKECGFCTSYGISQLIDRCFLTIGKDNELIMHQLVQEMGRNLVRQESPEKPWKRSRLWNHEESLIVLIENKGTRRIQGLFFDMKILEKKQLGSSCSVTEQDDLKKKHRGSQLLFKTNAFEMMDNLKLLQLNHIKVNGSYKNFPKGLRWLCMHGFQMRYIPSELPMDNLVTLDMSYSDLKQLWRKPKMLESLRFLNLSYCNVVNVGGFSRLPSLERLILTGCVSLIQICESIGGCERLVLLDLSYCKKLKEIPSSINKLKKLEILSIDCCFGVSNFTKHLLGGPKLFFLSLPASLVKLSLANTNLFDESFPMDFSSMSMLKELYLDNNPILSLPACVRSLCKLETLHVNGCLMLKSVLYPPSTLKYLGTENCLSLEKITFLPEITRPPVVYYQGSICLNEIEGIIKFQGLAQVSDEILCALGWTNLQCLNNQKVRIKDTITFPKEMRLPVQMCYEFGIFSIYYLGKKVPSWFSHKRNGSSISFTMPSSQMNKSIQGLNICFVHTSLRRQGRSYLLIKIRNMTKKRTWIYWSSKSVVVEAEEDIVWLSHWMFGNELEDEDEVCVTIFDSEEEGAMVKECAINLIYIHTDMEEDPLSDCKLWNLRIGGDLCDFQLTSGNYFLFHFRSLVRLNFNKFRDKFTEKFQHHKEIGKFINYFDGYKELDGTEI